MLIRQFRESDRGPLREITIEAFDGVSIEQNIERHFGAIGGHDWQWRKARQVDDDMAVAEGGRLPQGGFILVAETDEGDIAGYVTARVDREAGVGFIPNIAVRAGQRGCGLGRKLIERCLEEFEKEGLSLARIETLDQNPVGQHLYPDCGFVEVARQIHFARRIGE